MSGSLKPILIVALGAFLLGALVVGYLAWRTGFDFGVGEGEPAVVEAGSSEPGPLASATPTPAATSSSSPSSPDASVESVERVAQQQGGIDQRLAAAEQRLSRLDLQAQAAAGNAARAEGLLIAFAARRSLERGADLGYLADQLRLRFGDAKPRSVETIIEFSRNPVTLDVLVARLEGLAPELADATGEPFFERVQQELGSLFVIRRESTPSPQPQKRLERARFFLESGRIDKAIDEVSALPGAEQAQRWIADARRYERAQNALDLIETSAVLEPMRLRDGAGNRINQPSPADQNVPAD